MLCLGYGVARRPSCCWPTRGDGAWAAAGPDGQRRRGPQAEIDALLSEPGVMPPARWSAPRRAGTLLSVPFWHAPALVHWGGQGVARRCSPARWPCGAAAAPSSSTAWPGGADAGPGLVTALLFGAAGPAPGGRMLVVPAGPGVLTVFYVSLLFTFNDSFGRAGARASHRLRRRPERQSIGVSLAMASASHLAPWRPKLTWARASAPRLPASAPRLRRTWCGTPTGPRAGRLRCASAMAGGAAAGGPARRAIRRSTRPAPTMPQPAAALPGLLVLPRIARAEALLRGVSHFSAPRAVRRRSGS
jgi:hypothetical protein